MKKTIYKITVLNWEKYNGDIKPGHKKIMLSTRFLDDSKIRAVTPVTRLLYLSCLLVAGELTRGQIEVSHESLVFHSGVKSGSLQSQLDQLQSLQLLTYEKIDPLITRQDKKRHNKKVLEVAAPEKSEPHPVEQIPFHPDLSPEPEKPVVVGKKKNLPVVGTQDVIARYCELWKIRYGTNPPVGGSASGKFKELVTDHGKEKALQFIEAYLRMPDQWFLTKRHDVWTLLANLNAVAQFIATGKTISRKEIQQFDQAVSNQNTLNALREGKV